MFERLDVDERDEDDGARNLNGVECGNEFFDGDDRNVFSAVSAGDEREDFPGLGAVNDDDRNAGGGVNTGRNFESARRFLAGCGRGGADSEFRLSGNGFETERNEKGQGENRSERTHHSPPAFVAGPGGSVGRAGVGSPLT